MTVRKKLAAGPTESGASELRQALKACRGALLGVGITSGFINLLMLTGSLYMLEVYDRVLPSRSVPTLVGLSLLVGVLYVFLGALEVIRSRVLIRIGSSLDAALSVRVYDALVRMPLRMQGPRDGTQPLRDLDQIRSYFSGAGLSALFDVPWIPLYLGICFAFHILIGMAALLGGLLLVGLATLTEVAMRAPATTASQLGARRNALAEASRRSSEAVHAMGMAGRLADRWARNNAAYMTAQRRASDISAGIGNISKIARIALQSGILGLGGYLVIHQQATAGIIIASSILSSRALSPIDQVIARWGGFTAARQSWQRLTDLLRLFERTENPMALPDARQSLAAKDVAVIPPGSRIVAVHDVTFDLSSGDALGIVGPSGSGKSSLARAMVGVWPLARGSIRLDGATLDQWPAEQLGTNVGFLPQDVELFAGSIADNISRFDAKPDPDSIIRAAKIAGVHDMILKQPDGYETEVGEGGMTLSAGQRQRVALARALYGDPFLVVLDEPNSNLDTEGDAALTRAIMHTRDRGGVVAIIAHRPSALAAVNLLLVMTDNRMQDFGPRDEVMSRLLRRSKPAQGSHVPLKAAAE